jgi:transposase-like protein
MICSHCQSTNTHKNKRNPKSQIWRCLDCGLYFSNSTRKRGGQVKGDVKMSNALRQKLFRERKKDNA